MNQFTRRILFLLFFLSGCSSLIYQVVWTRMAFASFGIIMPVLSVVLSVFMLGLAIGSWLGGRWIIRWSAKTGLSAIGFYALAELIIGLGAFAVPKLFAFGEKLLLSSGETDSFRYLFLSALVLAVSILPWCVCMGTSFPFMMAYIREGERSDAESFSFLYLANVLGAMSGTFLSALVLVELFGFHHTLWLAAAGNLTIALIGGCLGWKRRRAGLMPPAAEIPAAPAASLHPSALRGWLIKWILFSTGFITMAMEVVWTRAFTPVLKTQVYSFALIVFTYLGATFFGSLMYRIGLRKNRVWSPVKLFSALAIAAFLPVLANDPRIMGGYSQWTPDAISTLFLLGSLCPFCATLGYLTPRLIDEYAAGQPERVGQVYAINILGCILGPLFACYCLLPFLSERWSLILLALPFPVLWLAFYKSSPQQQRDPLLLAIGTVFTLSVWFAEDFETALENSTKPVIVRRDYAATVISLGEDWNRRLLVNGIGMTQLTPITKFMAHLPLAYHQGTPKSALVICFGMGTSFRSALSWDIDTTAVELVPSVTKAFDFYHADASEVLARPQAHVVIDDGRRYLKRCGNKFDVIIVDPPPPIEAAGSSLLYSKEFYALAREHLNTNGILQMWFPGGGEEAIGEAAVRSIHESFPYIRYFPPIHGQGLHMLASMKPIEQLDPAQLATRMPATAKKDLLEWNDSQDVPAYLGQVVTNELSIDKLLNPNPQIQITDDRPFNEYFLLRRLKN